MAKLTPSVDSFQQVRVAALLNVVDSDGFLTLHTEAVANSSTLICVSVTYTPPVGMASSSVTCRASR